MPSISYAITACNEHVELDRLLKQLTEHIHSEDEIVVQTDSLNTTAEVRDVLTKYHDKINNSISFNLNSDFASFKNNLKSYCSKDWIFFIDADEYLGDNLIEYIHEVLELNKNLVDVIAIPRINTVEGITKKHIYKWRWYVDKNEWINYPDYQTRICVNKPEIKWVYKIHERLLGWKTIATLPEGEGYDLMHPKTIERQEKQIDHYNTILYDKTNYI